jgi:ribosomal protein S18 acetylase RimI-like enzyme
MTIEQVTSVTPTLVEAMNVLLPQLSTSAKAVTTEALEAIVTAPGTLLLVAIDDDRVVGTITLITFALLTGRRALIEDVIVDESVRGRGIGVALVEEALSHARRMGVSTIDLTSRPAREAANALYRKVGFVQRTTNVYRYSFED